MENPGTSPGPTRTWPAESEVISFFSRRVVGTVVRADGASGLPVMAGSLSMTRQQGGILCGSSIGRLSIADDYSRVMLVVTTEVTRVGGPIVVK